MDIGIMGSGQLGWMMIIEGRKLKNRYFVLDKDNGGPAAKIADGFFELSDYREFVDKCDVVTYEFENVSTRALEYAQECGKLYPSLEPVRLKKDRTLEKEYLSENGFPIAKYASVGNISELRRVRKDFGKCVIKARGGGYDGKGQYFFEEEEALADDIPEGSYVIEEFIDYQYEASVIASRDAEGNFSAHKPSYNLNREAILISNAAPIEDHGMTAIVKSLMDRLGYVGVMGVEFYISSGKPIINEFAPRVHNTGHHTLHGSSISQFEQHIRAISGMPVPEPELFVPSGIMNIIGTDPDDTQIRNILSIGGTRYYWYWKNGVRKKRKVGHVNVTSDSYDSLKRKLEQVSELIYGDRLPDYL